MRSFESDRDKNSIYQNQQSPRKKEVFKQLEERTLDLIPWLNNLKLLTKINIFFKRLQFLLASFEFRG